MTCLRLLLSRISFSFLSFFSNVAEPSLVWHCLASFLAAADVISNANCGSGGAAIKKTAERKKDIVEAGVAGC